MLWAGNLDGTNGGASGAGRRRYLRFVAERRVSREQVLAFRAASHSLGRRRPPAQLRHVVGACGIQDTPPGNADVSLAARLDLDGPVVGRAVAERELLLTWSLRGAPHLFPPDDFAAFTIGARPADGTLQRLWGQPEDALVAVEGAMVSVIGDEPRPKGEVSAGVTALLPPALAPWCAACKVNHPSESVFRAAPLLGRLLLASTAPVLLAKATMWVGADAQGEVDAVRTELVRRYLHCYGPTTPAHFAEWAGITKADAKQRWACGVGRDRGRRGAGGPGAGSPGAAVIRSGG